MTEVPWRWLPSNEHPFDGAVLDMRRLATHARTEPESEEAKKRFEAVRSLGPPEWVGEEVRCEGERHYPPPEGEAEGVLFLAASYEEKWDLFCTDGELIAVRSWSGEPVLRARLELEGDELALFDVRCRPEWGPELAVAELDFLIWSVLYGRPVPHPVPAGMLQDVETAVRWSFGRHGRFAWFATECDVADALRAEVEG